MYKILSMPRVAKLRKFLQSIQAHYIGLFVFATKAKPQIITKTWMPMLFTKL